MKQSGAGNASGVHVSRETKKRSGAPSAVEQATIQIMAGNVRERVARWLCETTLKPRDGIYFLERIEKMAATLALWGAHTNLTADASDPAEIAFHIIDSLAPMAFASDADHDALEAALGESATALDLGSGAGFPGLVLAAAFGAQFTLTEARRKRASYLQVAAHEMDLDNVAIEQRRAHARTIASGVYHLVTARAFGTSTELYEIAAAALRPGGVLLLYESADQATLDDSLAHDSLAQALLAERSTWTYRLPHGERVVSRTAVLWRKSRTVSMDF